MKTPLFEIAYGELGDVTFGEDKRDAEATGLGRSFEEDATGENNPPG